VGVEGAWLAYRAGMARQIVRWAPDNWLPLFYDAVFNYHNSSPVIFCSMELAVREPAAWILCGYGFIRRFSLVCFESVLWN
jgi:hypothetical protein